LKALFTIREMATSHSAPLRPWNVRLRSWAETERLQRHENKVFLVLALMIGAVVGMAVVAFILLTEGFASRLYPASGAAWRRLVIPTLGALAPGRPPRTAAARRRRRTLSEFAQCAAAA
jgi:hypothetical protein